MKARLSKSGLPAMAWSPGLAELLIILVIVLVLFGAGKLPQVGRSLGDAISEFKDSVKPPSEKKAGAASAADQEEETE